MRYIHGTYSGISVKRGLVGTVMIDDDSVQIAAQGPEARLESFANWIESTSALVMKVEMKAESECPASELSAKFPLSDTEPWSGGKEGSFAGELAEKLKSLSVAMESKRGTTHSNDEGLF